MYKAKQDRIYEDGKMVGWFPGLHALTEFVVSALNSLAKGGGTDEVDQMIKTAHENREKILRETTNTVNCGYPPEVQAVLDAARGYLSIFESSFVSVCVEAFHVNQALRKLRVAIRNVQDNDKAYFSAVTRPGSFGMPSQFAQEADPAVSGTATCNHDRLLQLVAGGVQWCRKCGSVRTDSGQMWKVPYRESERGR